MNMEIKKKYWWSYEKSDDFELIMGHSGGSWISHGGHGPVSGGMDL